MIFENDSAIVFLPYFARYAYECFVTPKATHAGLRDLSRERAARPRGGAEGLLVRYDNLWQMPFPYVLTFHHAPTDNADHAGFHFHSSAIPRCASPAC